jgi:dihydrofolate reductase
MRTITYGGAVSLDGYLAAAAGSLDWLHFSRDVEQITSDYFKGVDAILMGRKTWDVAAAQHRPAAARPRGGKSRRITRTYVFSRTLSSIDAPDVELVSADAVAFVRDLKHRQGGKICLMGGGELATSLLAADLIDEVGLNVHPVLLGTGIPVFRDPGVRVKLKLTECRRLDGGCVLMTYVVASRKSQVASHDS